MMDPTRIDISTDPTQQRMSGIARHGRTPFDVTYISQINDRLWQGGCETGFVLPAFIENVVSLYPWERYKIQHEVRSETYIRMYDSVDGIDRDHVRAIARWVNEQEGVTLVHCQAGLNRSSLIACTALVMDGMQPGEAIALVRDKRSPACLCNPAFEAFVHTVRP